MNFDRPRWAERKEDQNPEIIARLENAHRAILQVMSGKGRKSVERVRFCRKLLDDLRRTANHLDGPFEPGMSPDELLQRADSILMGLPAESKYKKPHR